MRFGRKGSKAVSLSVLLSIYVHGRYGSARPKYSHSQGHSGKLQMVDLLYLWQLIYIRINEAMCSSILLTFLDFNFVSNV